MSLVTQRDFRVAKSMSLEAGIKSLRYPPTNCQHLIPIPILINISKTLIISFLAFNTRSKQTYTQSFPTQKPSNTTIAKMKFATSVSAITLLAGSALASPFRAASPLLNVRDDVQIAHLTFQAGPVNYTMAVPANGQVYQTSESAPHTYLQKHTFYISV
jgi:hypothetical protein